MKKTALLVAALVAGSSVYAQEASSVSVTLDNTIASEYIFRGKELGDVTFHPSIEAAYGDFYAGVWAALPEDSAFDEVDFYAGYGFALNDTWSLDAGATYYYYSGASETSTFEPYVGVSGEVAGLSVSFYGYYDLQIDDLTVQTSVGYSIPVEAIGSSLDFSATLGWVHGDGNEAGPNLVDEYFYYGVGVAVPYKLTDSATLTAAVNYTDVTENLINDGAEISYTLGLSVGF